MNACYTPEEYNQTFRKYLQVIGNLMNSNNANQTQPNLDPEEEETLAETLEHDDRFAAQTSAQARQTDNCHTSGHLFDITDYNDNESDQLFDPTTDNGFLNQISRSSQFVVQPIPTATAIATPVSEILVHDPPVTIPSITPLTQQRGRQHSIDELIRLGKKAIIMCLNLTSNICSLIF